MANLTLIDKITGDEIQLSPVKPVQQVNLLETWFTVSGKTRTLPEADTAGRYILARRKNLWGKTESLQKFFPLKNGGSAVIEAALLHESRKVLFPGALEQLVEMILRKMTLEQHAEMELFQDEKSIHHLAVSFTLYSLRQKLAQDGHERAVRDIREAIEVLDGCNWKIEAPINREFVGELHGSILRIGGIRKIKQTKGDSEKDLYTCYWHPLIAEEILTNKGLLIDAGITKIKDPLARWAANRLNARYRQASKSDFLDGKGYTLSLKTVLAESGIEAEPRLRDTLERIRKALDELKEAGFLHSLKPYSETLDMEATSRKPKIIDAKWVLHPSTHFADSVIEGNREKLA